MLEIIHILYVVTYSMPLIDLLGKQYFYVLVDLVVTSTRSSCHASLLL